MKYSITFFLFFLAYAVSAAQKVDYSQVSVQEEAGLELQKMTRDGDYVAMPRVKRNGRVLDWMTNRILGASPDGSHLAFLSFRDGISNIFIKDIEKQGNSVQRTNRKAIQDFSYSPDGKTIIFSEERGKKNNAIFTTDARQGYVCRQITSNEMDFSPIMINAGNVIFSRQESRGAGIWGYNMKDNFLSSYTSGINPTKGAGTDEILIGRINDSGMGEIWKINLTTGLEECILADPNHSFTSPLLSPNGQWILLVGDGKLPFGNGEYKNTDIFVCRPDGSELTQLTYHAADDLSPVWSADGRYIYFISQRGDSEGKANVWRMNFNY